MRTHRDCLRAVGSRVLWALGSPRSPGTIPLDSEGGTRAPGCFKAPQVIPRSQSITNPSFKGAFVKAVQGLELRFCIQCSFHEALPRRSSTEPFTPWAFQLTGHLEPKSLYLGSLLGPLSPVHVTSRGDINFRSPQPVGCRPQGPGIYRYTKLCRLDMYYFTTCYKILKACICLVNEIDLRIY